MSFFTSSKVSMFLSILLVILLSYSYVVTKKKNNLEEKIRIKEENIKQLQTTVNQVTTSYNSCQQHIESMRNDYDRKIRKYVSEINKYKNFSSQYTTITYSSNQETCENLKQMLDQLVNVEKAVGEIK